MDGRDFFPPYLWDSPSILILNANDTETVSEKKSDLNYLITFICENPNVSS